MSSAQAVNRGRPASTCRGLAIGESEWCSSCLNPKAKATCLRKKGLWPPIGPASDVEATQKDCGPGDLANSSSSTSVPAGCFDAASQEADAEQLPKSSAPSRHPGCRTCASGTAFCVSNPNIAQCRTPPLSILARTHGGHNSPRRRALAACRCPDPTVFSRNLAIQGCSTRST